MATRWIAVVSAPNFLCNHLLLRGINMSTVQPPFATPALPDRSTRLMLFGIFQILLGCLCGLMGLMMVALVAMLGPMAQDAAGRGR